MSIRYGYLPDDDPEDGDGYWDGLPDDDSEDGDEDEDSPGGTP
jgi:hypothetical protein